MSQLSFDVIKRVWPKSGLTTFLKSTPELFCLSAYQTDQCDQSECYFPSKYAASINQYYIGIGPTQS